MAILVSADKPTYFPDVTLAGDALTGALVYAQALCESGYGANRRLEQQQYTRALRIYDRATFLPFLPVVSVDLVRVRVRRDSWGRVNQLEWFTLGAADWVLDRDLGRVLFQSIYPVQESEVTFTAGYDFTAVSPSRDVTEIKACAGRVLTHISNNRPGLETYQLDAGVLASVETVRYSDLDDTLKQLLMPLQRYAATMGT